MSSSALSRVLVVLGVIASAVFLWGIHIDSHTVRLISKPLPVLFMLIWTLRQGSSPYIRWIALGLLFSIGGDVLLEIHSSYFLYGLISFLIAHIFYIVGFLQKNKAPAWGRLVPFFLYGAGAYAFLFQKLGPMTIPVGVYVSVICAMMWRASACVQSGDRDASILAWAALLGAMSFAVSDSMIAFNKFHAPFYGARVWIIVLYWLGQWGITYSTRSKA
ncbi:MAG: lysoplasmalogenase [Deltaproteobacteria bacterium]|nr:MAG: lysoplasmalogenase [Deltaproteobacteria bacterium]